MSELVESANSLKSVIIAHRDCTESNRRLAPNIVAGLKAAGLCRMGLPRELGGLEGNPTIALSVYEALASAEASVSWIVWNNHLACTFGRFLKENVRRSVFGDENHMYANSTRPEGVAKVVDGGYLVSGKWTLVSGCELSDWFALRCIVQTTEEIPALGPGTKLRLLFIPKSEVTTVDTWHVGGLRGTGSHDVEVNNAFVPLERSVAFDEPNEVGTPYSNLPIGCMNSAGCGAMALGLAQTAHDALVEIGLSRVTPGKNPDLRDRPQVQASVADSHVTLNATRSYLHSCVDRLWKKVCVSDKISNEELANVWSSAYLAATASRSALNQIYAVAGTVSLYTSSPIERSHRDIHALLQHGIIQPHWMNQSGMVRMGLEPSAPMFRT